MSFKDHNEFLSGVPLGHTAFTSVPPKAPEKTPAPKKKQKYMSKAQLSISVLDSDEERAEKRKAAAEARRSIFASAKEVAIAARSATQSNHVAKQRAAGVDMLTIHRLSHKADERIRQFKERAKAITALKPANSFNTHIASQDESRKTAAISGNSCYFVEQGDKDRAALNEK